MHTYFFFSLFLIHEYVLLNWIRSVLDLDSFFWLLFHSLISVSFIFDVAVNGKVHSNASGGKSSMKRIYLHLTVSIKSDCIHWNWRSAQPGLWFDPKICSVHKMTYDPTAARRIKTEKVFFFGDFLFSRLHSFWPDLFIHFFFTFSIKCHKVLEKVLFL